MLGVGLTVGLGIDVAPVVSRADTLGVVLEGDGRVVADGVGLGWLATLGGAEEDDAPAARAGPAPVAGAPSAAYPAHAAPSSAAAIDVRRTTR